MQVVSDRRKFPSWNHTLKSVAPHASFFFLLFWNKNNLSAKTDNEVAFDLFSSSISIIRFLHNQCFLLPSFIVTRVGAVRSYPGELSSLPQSHDLSSVISPTTLPVHRAPLSPLDPTQRRMDSRRSSTSSVSSVGTCEHRRWRTWPEPQTFTVIVQFKPPWTWLFR